MRNGSKVKLLIALAGPLTSVSLGALMLVSVAVVTAAPNPTASDAPWTVGGLGPLAMLLVWLGSANVLLGVLNLVPGSPLNGGAVLHSFLWAAGREPKRALNLASRVARVAAWSLIAAGLLTIALAPTTWTDAGVFGGMALVLIGWLVARAADQYTLQSAIDEMLESMPVTSLPGGEILSVPPNIPVSSLLSDYVLSANDCTWPVIDQGRLVGLVHPADVRNVPREQWDTTEVGEIMTGVDQWLEAKNMA